MHRDLVLQYIELQALIVTPIASHWADYIWSEVLNKASHSPQIKPSRLTLAPQPASIQLALWPKVPLPQPHLTAAREYVRHTSSSITSAEGTQLKKKEKGKSIAFDPKLPKRISIFAAISYPAWQEKYIDLVRANFDRLTLSLDDKSLGPQIAKMGEMKKAMPFVQGLKRRLQAGESEEVVFNRKLAFDELDVLVQMRAGLKKTTGCIDVEIVALDEGGAGGTVAGSDKGGEKREGLPPAAQAAVPGNPTFHFENVKTAE